MKKRFDDDFENSAALEQDTIYWSLEDFLASCRPDLIDDPVFDYDDLEWWED